MTPQLDLGRVRLFYTMAEQRYQASLTLENYMESPQQATQRAVTLASFAVIRTQRPDVQVFNELLVQYPPPGVETEERPSSVVPDNMVVIHPTPLVLNGSFKTPLQPVGPFLMLEYVSKSNSRKDYEVNMLRYQNELRVPYYLLFYPDNDELTVFRLVEGEYQTVLPNDAGRLEIPELELEVALLGEWVRYWFRGKLVQLPGDLAIRVEALELNLEAAELKLAAQDAELVRLRAELANRPAAG